MSVCASAGKYTPGLEGYFALTMERCLTLTLRVGGLKTWSGKSETLSEVNRDFRPRGEQQISV